MKKVMQKILFLDYMDGVKIFNDDKIAKEANLQTYLSAFNSANTIKTSFLPGNIQFDFSEFQNSLINKHPAYGQELFDEVMSNQALRMTLVDYSKCYNDSTRKNYIFSHNLTEALSKTKIEQDTTIFQEERSFYFEMPSLTDSDLQVFCIYGFTIKVGDRFMLIIYLFVKHKLVWRTIDFTFQIQEGQSLASEFERIMIGDTLDEFHNSSKINYKDVSIYRTILNGIIYIYNNCEEMDEKLNEFSSKKSKLEVQAKIYTSKPFVELGSNFTFLKMIKDQEVDVRGHFRWQPCGEKRQQVKLIYISPHNRQLTKRID